MKPQVQMPVSPKKKKLSDNDDIVLHFLFPYAGLTENSLMFYLLCI
jgi:hypothetical protein